ncbi:MAG: PEP-CTERM sorting domain-containing protein [Fimbriimonadaceae bacterium]|nr:PEP-CTERM sorting domain-containing protein [Fimbriimonadaceae bacterium]NUM39037.1 PEP-CTERM sorting domain-containing protein [Armatimonadota bacterium]
MTRFVLVWSAALFAAPLTMAQLNLIEIGGVPQTGNVALASIGAQPHASSVISGYPFHAISGLNDGWYGNNGNINYGDGVGASGASWIPTAQTATAGISLPTPATIGRIAWGRDSSVTWNERTSGLYTVKVSTDSLPFFDTGKTWHVIGSVQLQDYTSTDSLRHLYSFAPQVGVTDVKIDVTAYGQPVCIEEIEVYAAVPEPGTLAALSVAAVRAGVPKRRRKARG